MGKGSVSQNRASLVGLHAKRELFHRLDGAMKGSFTQITKTGAKQTVTNFKRAERAADLTARVMAKLAQSGQLNVTGSASLPRSQAALGTGLSGDGRWLNTVVLAQTIERPGIFVAHTERHNPGGGPNSFESFQDAVAPPKPQPADLSPAPPKISQLQLENFPPSARVAGRALGFHPKQFTALLDDLSGFRKNPTVEHERRAMAAMQTIAERGARYAKFDARSFTVDHFTIEIFAAFQSPRSRPGAHPLNLPVDLIGDATLTLANPSDPYGFNAHPYGFAAVTDLKGDLTAAKYVYRWPEGRRT